MVSAASSEDTSLPEQDGRRAQNTGSHSSDRTRFYAQVSHQFPYYQVKSCVSQLEQLRLMGIHDETACLHALAATDGDLQAALEILYSQ